MLQVHIKHPVHGKIPVPYFDFLRKMRNFNEGTYYQRLEKETRHLAVIKPERRLAAPWMDDFIQRRKAISVCFNCKSKYHKDIQRFGYVTSPWIQLSDCDACSRVNARCHGYYAMETKTGKVITANK